MAGVRKTIKIWLELCIYKLQSPEQKGCETTGPHRGVKDADVCEHFLGDTVTLLPMTENIYPIFCHRHICDEFIWIGTPATLAQVLIDLGQNDILAEKECGTRIYNPSHNLQASRLNFSHPFLDSLRNFFDDGSKLVTVLEIGPSLGLQC